MRALSDLELDRSARPTLQEQLARQIRERIRVGDLAPGDPLPSSRDLASELKVSRNTAVYAYERLISEGYLQSAPRAGIFVSSTITLPRSDRDLADVQESKRNAKVAVQRPLTAPRPFRPCQPDVGLFPLLTWNRMRGRALRREGRNILHYQASCVAGFPSLRENVATYLRDHRGVRCDGHQVVITSGSQQALFLLALLLAGPRDLPALDAGVARRPRRRAQRLLRLALELLERAELLRVGGVAAALGHHAEDRLAVDLALEALLGERAAVAEQA